MTLALELQLPNEPEPAAQLPGDSSGHRAAGGGAPGAAELLQSVNGSRIQLEAPCPWDQCLRLSRLHWQEAGLLPFAQGSVPYVINNSGRLSEHCAVLLFENLNEHEPPPGELAVLELGAGSGLFAKLFLDAFRYLPGQRARLLRASAL